MSEKEANTQTYEKAFKRLEDILQQMNESRLSLDDSMKLFEEATSLVSFCEKKLEESEKKIELLLKTKSGELQLDPITKKPMTRPLSEEQQA